MDVDMVLLLEAVTLQLVECIIGNGYGCFTEIRVFTHAKGLCHPLFVHRNTNTYSHTHNKHAIHTQQLEKKIGSLPRWEIFTLEFGACVSSYFTISRKKTASFDCVWSKTGATAFIVSINLDSCVIGVLYDTNIFDTNVQFLFAFHISWK